MAAKAILVSDWLLFKKIFSSETAWQNGAKLGRKHLCKILYKTSSVGFIRPTNMGIYPFDKKKTKNTERCHRQKFKLNLYLMYT
jgi:hypothetical protein